MKLKHIIILQNKIDLVRESQAKDQYKQILKFVEGIWFILLKELSYIYLNSCLESVDKLELIEVV